eukprot:TRINITY_DN8535_c2_g1_i5.p1 TRINITY_DN8535_c2_g1~~TRINITY_DN8535_c2_g1_i5.p1  ORF type:complete len:358 (+),score=89.35 TRINITY_DN8535_c2_g1_i5:102-1175(+)
MDFSAMGCRVVQINTTSQLELVLNCLGGEKDLKMKQDLTINEKLIEKGKTLTLVGKEMVTRTWQVEKEIKEKHCVTDEGEYVPPVDLAFVNMDVANQAIAGIAAAEEQKKKQRLAEEQRELEEEDEQEDEEILKEAGDLSYKLQQRIWQAVETQVDDVRKDNEHFVSGGAPKRLEVQEVSKKSSEPKERPISRYMTSDPDKKGVRKVYLEDPEVVSVEKESIEVSFSMNYYTVRVKTANGPMVLGPIDCGYICPEECSWRFSQGKRLTLTLAPTPAGKIEAERKEMLERMKANAQKPKPAQSGPPASAESVSKAADLTAARPEPEKTTKEDNITLYMGALVVLLAVLLALYRSSFQR